MNIRSKYLFKNVGILTISNFSSKILVFLLVPLYTSVLSTNEVGIYDLIVSTIYLVYPIFSVNIIDGVMRFTMDKETDKNEVVSIGIKYIAISWILGAVVLSVFRWLRIVSVIQGFETFIYFYYFFYILNQFLNQYSKGLECVLNMGIAGIISTITLLLGNIFFLFVLKSGLQGFIVANVLAQAMSSIYLFVSLKFWKNFKEIRINSELQKEMLLYCTPLLATTLGWWVNSAFDKYIVTIMCGITANGLLAVSYKVPQIINTLQGIFVQAWQISAIKEFGENDVAYFYGKTFRIVNMLMCAACAWFIVLAKPIGHILYQGDFYVAWKYVPLLLISSVFNSASGILGPILSAKKDSKSMALSAVYGAVSNILLNILFVCLVGIQGATIATVISSIIIFVIRKKSVKGNIEIEGYGYILITWILLMIQAVIEINTNYWWLESFLMIVMLVLNWNTFIEIFGIGKKIVIRK